MIKNEETDSRATSMRQLMTNLRWLFKNINTLRAMRLLERMRAILVRVNMSLAKLRRTSDEYHARASEFNQAMIEASKGKWYTAQAMTSRSRRDWRRALASIRKARKMGDAMLLRITEKSSNRLALDSIELDSDNAEIQFADGVPLVPGINPIVILQGSDAEMGYQYAQQLLHVFGS